MTQPLLDRIVPFAVVLAVFGMLFAAGALAYSDAPPEARGESATASTVEDLHGEAVSDGSCSLSASVQPADGERVVIDYENPEMGVVGANAFSEGTAFGTSVVRGNNVTISAVDVENETMQVLNRSHVEDDCSLTAVEEEADQ